MLYGQGIVDSTTDGRLQKLTAYGIYLMNGGKKEDFEDMTDFDHSLIHLTYEAYQVKQVNKLAEVISKMLGGE